MWRENFPVGSKMWHFQVHSSFYNKTKIHLSDEHSCSGGLIVSISFFFILILHGLYTWTLLGEKGVELEFFIYEHPNQYIMDPNMIWTVL